MPPAHHVQHGTAAALSAHPPRDEHTHRPRLRSGDICAGCIVWLPPRKDHESPTVCNRERCCGGEGLQDDGYNHPVVVLSIRQRVNSMIPGELVCSVACVTTFSKTPLALYLERRSQKRHYQTSLPIVKDYTEFLNNPDLHSLKTLVLESGSLRKQSYVRLEHTYNVPVSMLAQYAWNHCRAYKIRLSNSSYDVLMGELGLVPDAFEETATLYETESRRLSALANSVTRTSTVIPAQAVSELPPTTQSQPVYQHFPTRNPLSHPSIPAARYGAISSIRTPRYLPPSHSYTSIPSSSPEPSGDLFSSIFICLIGFVVIGSFAFVGWKYSQL